LTTDITMSAEIDTATVAVKAMYSRRVMTGQTDRQTDRAM